MVFGKEATDRYERVNFDRLRKERVEKAKAQLTKDGLGAVICFEPGNIRYLTGFEVPGYARGGALWLAMLPRNGDPVLYVSGTLTDVVSADMPWLKGRVRKRPGIIDWDYLTLGKSIHDLEKEVASVMDEAGVKKEPLGLDSFPGSVFFLQEVLGKVGINLVDGRRAMMTARTVKTKDEIELHRIACANVEVAFDAIREAIRPGITERQLAGIAAKTLLDLGDDAAPMPVVCSGFRTNPNRLDCSDKPIRPGEMIFIDLAATSYCGYHTCVYRTFTCGRATEAQKDAYARTRKMVYDGMSVVKAGNTTLDICNAWPGPEHWGYKDWRTAMNYAIGHGVGLELHELPAIVTDFARIKPVKLQEDMVIALETWDSTADGKEGCRLEEMMAVTKDGYDLLTRYPSREITEAWI